MGAGAAYPGTEATAGMARQVPEEAEEAGATWAREAMGTRGMVPRTPGARGEDTERTRVIREVRFLVRGVVGAAGMEAVVEAVAVPVGLTAGTPLRLPVAMGAAEAAHPGEMEGWEVTGITGATQRDPIFPRTSTC